MIHKISKWVIDNEDTIMQVYAFGLSIALAVSLISLSFIIR